MSIKVFVDGQVGTTGLMIHQRLADRDDIELLKINEELRKDPAEKKKLINAADVVFLCLPDEAAMESVSLVESESVCIIDASTAHRTDSQWAYGIPELSAGHREAIRNSKRISVPGCHATGFATLVYPLIAEKIIEPDYPLYCHSISGYSGAGKKLINRYNEEDTKGSFYQGPHSYALTLQHKHLPEMMIRNNLSSVPFFHPMVCNYYKGMGVSIPLIAESMKKFGSVEALRSFYRDYYQSELFVTVLENDGQALIDGVFYDPLACNDTNSLEISVFGNDQQILLYSRLDNLGKGASGAAVQCMNIVTGNNEDKGLKVHHV